jgi:hypothetical protein
MPKVSVSLCSGKTAYEVKIPTRIDLEAARGLFDAKVATKHLMIIKIGNAEASLYPSGRMLIKGVKSGSEALEIANQLIGRLGFDV